MQEGLYWSTDGFTTWGMFRFVQLNLPNANASISSQTQRAQSFPTSVLCSRGAKTDELIRIPPAHPNRQLADSRSLQFPLNAILFVWMSDLSMKVTPFHCANQPGMSSSPIADCHSFTYYLKMKPRRTKTKPSEVLFSPTPQPPPPSRKKRCMLIIQRCSLYVLLSS